MSRAKIIKKSIDTNELNSMVEQLLNDKGDPEIVAEKRESLISNVKMCSRIFGQFCSPTAVFYKTYFTSYPKWINDISGFVKECEKVLEEKSDYSDLKSSNTIKKLMLICRDLKPFSRYLEKQEETDPDFKGTWILTHPGHCLEPFTFTKLNLVEIWNHTDTDNRMKKYLIIMIKTLFNKCREIYQLITSPDIDITKFKEIIIGAIGKIKGIPELNRCKDAFRKIEESVDILDTNFDTYYKDMLQSQNTSLLMVNFIEDVSKTDNMNLKLVLQFRKIIGFYKKQSTTKIKDPEMLKRFEMLSSKFDMLDKQVHDHMKDNGEEVDADSSDTDQEEEKTNETNETNDTEEKSEDPITTENTNTEEKSEDPITTENTNTEEKSEDPITSI